jgi:hypothetical protein
LMDKEFGKSAEAKSVKVTGKTYDLGHGMS